MAVEFFVVDGGKLVVNEIAPRPHNSGHYTLDACLTSQFEMQVRTLCNLPIGATTQHTPAVMVNLLGDLWGDSQPNWAALLQHPAAKLHLYGKQSRPSRAQDGAFHLRGCLAGSRAGTGANHPRAVIRRSVFFIAC